MTKEELFPQNKFPKRIRKIIEYTAQNVRITVEIYFRNNTADYDLDPPDGMIALMEEIDGTMSFVLAEIVDEVFVDEAIYVFVDGNFIKVSSKEAEEAVSDKLEEFNVKLTGGIEKAEIVHALIEKSSSVPWEEF